MAIRGAASSIGRQTSTTSLLSISGYLRTRYHEFKYSIRAIQGAAADPVTPKKEDEEQLSKEWKIKMLYDGECSLCMREVMGRIHAILSDGAVVKNVEAFRKLYEAVGLGWVYAITKYKPVATIADVVYGVWAKYRLQITGHLLG
ncbi:unnamed protein product [Ilex paraguariensis]|uniref:Uncharacterized protein n=1 Tax=Ilex paraguariensis TaxID=185542 RepID=A0ABC8U6E7_9AQUA